MKKGISPIVAVVLLIAIAVIAAVGLYFWVTSMATPKATTTTPYTITASCMGAGTNANGTLFIYNTGSEDISLSSNNIKITQNDVLRKTLSSGTISAGDYEDYTAAEINATLTVGDKLIVSGNAISPVSVVCNP